MAETTIVSFHTLPVGFPLPTISKNSLCTLFCSLILDHGVLLKISVSGAKILISNFLLGTSFHHSFQSLIIRFELLLMCLQVIQFQYGLTVRPRTHICICICICVCTCTCTCICVCVCVSVSVSVSVSVCAHVYVFDLPQWFHVFLLHLSHFLYILHMYVYMSS